jgi:adenosylcobinamide kinase / adenosylcobinamide-phosphate guanylyltransferase
VSLFEAPTAALHSGHLAPFAGPRSIPTFQHTTLVLGGARSGKSKYAEQLLTRHAAPWVYIATAQPFDDEMRSRIADHRMRRGDQWRTIEEPIALSDALDREAARPVLIDCLTLWLTNLTLGGHDIASATSDLAAALRRRRKSTVLVSNEVGLGIIPQTSMGRSFRDDAGRLNQLIAAEASHVVFMIAGLPMTLR